MDRLLDTVSALVELLPPERLQNIASRVRQTDSSKADTALANSVNSAPASSAVQDLVSAWRAVPVGADEVASMLLAAGHVYAKASANQTIELVWTGPTTPFVATRRTEQALLQVINAAQSQLFITSFVAYDIASILTALNAASARGVRISMLLESSQDHGGTIDIDSIGKLKASVPAASLYAWREKAPEFTGGRVHAKVAVADGRVCFITSANLTGYAMERNMEAGVLMTGGHIPKLIEHHLAALVDTRVVSKV